MPYSLTSSNTCVVIENFVGSWDFIYAEYVMAAGHHHRSIVWQVTAAKLFMINIYICT